MIICFRSCFMHCKFQFGLIFAPTKPHALSIASSSFLERRTKEKRAFAERIYNFCERHFCCCCSSCCLKLFSCVETVPMNLWLWSGRIQRPHSGECTPPTAGLSILSIVCVHCLLFIFSFIEVLFIQFFPFLSFFDLLAQLVHSQSQTVRAMQDSVEKL